MTREDVTEGRVTFAEVVENHKSGKFWVERDYQLFLVKRQEAQTEKKTGGEDMTNPRRINILRMIAADMKNDAERFEGRSFNGKTVAEYLGNLGATVAALANIVRETEEDKEG